MLIAIYHMLKYDLPFRDLGEGYYNRFNSEKKINYYLKKLQNLGRQPPNICYGLSIIQPKKPGPVPGQFPVPFFGRSLPYFHNNDMLKLAACPRLQLCPTSQTRSPLPVCLETHPYTRRRISVFSMSLRTSAHTGVAIRSPCGSAKRKAPL